MSQLFRRRARAVALGSLVMVSIVAAGCGSSQDATAEPGTTTAPTSSGGSPADGTAVEPASFPATIDHELGSTVIDDKPQRVVSASVTTTGFLLAVDAPVVASGATRPGPLADENGFFTQWSEIAAELGVEPLPGPELSIEQVAALEPDLIVGSAVGGDAVTAETFALLEQIAPTIVVDPSSTGVDELLGTLGRATGNPEAAAHAVETLDARLAEVAGTVDTTHPVAVLTIAEEGGVNVLTSESLHGQILDELGFTIIETEGGELGGEAGASTRSDVVAVSPENITTELGDSTLLFLYADEAAVDEAVASMPTLALLPAFAEDRVVVLGYEPFKLDPYSIATMLDALENG